VYDIDIEKKHDELIELLEEFLGEPRKHYSNKGQISFDCPNCSSMKGVDYDGKGNLEINYDMGVYNCWSCSETHETKGKIYNLFKEYADNSILKKFVSGKFKFTGDYYNSIEKPIQKETFELPKEYLSLHNLQKYKDFSNAFNYLYSRNISDEIIQKYKIGFCLDGLYQNRVVIPSYNIDNELNYFVTRAISPKVKKFKYLNPEIDKTQIIFNENLINWEKPIFLVEGAFDHIVVPNSIPLLGKKMYDKLFNDLYFKAKNYIIIALDSDAYGDCVKIYNKLDAGALRNKILINKMPQDHDISSFNQIYGSVNLMKWLKEKNYKIND
jgi:DNA primase